MDFETAKTRILASGQRSTGDNLTGMVIDFQIFLGRSDLLTDVQARADPHSPGVIHASAVLATPKRQPEAIAPELEKIWMTSLRYRFLEIHRIRALPGSTSLEFVTQIRSEGFHVSGEIVVSHNGSDG